MSLLSIAPVACFGEILWDILPTGRRLGGAPFNVCYHLGRLGVPARMISCIGADESGVAIRALLQEQQVDDAFVQVTPNAPTGYVFATEVRPNEMEYEIVEGVAWDGIVTTAGNLALVAEAPFFVFGSLAARSTISHDTLFALLENATCAVFDINLRQPFFSPGLISSLLEKTHILKINENELDILAGWFGFAGDTLQMLEGLYRRFALNEILLTRGADGALVYKDGMHWSRTGIATTVADTVGSGDAFLAGYLYARLSGAAMDQRIDFANQLAAWVTQFYGACPPYDNSVPELINHSLT